MKFSDSTLSLLKNFATINPGIEFKKGNVLRTISPQKNILVEATLEDEIPQDFCIHELNSFLSVLTLQKEIPNLAFDDKHVFIMGNNGRSKITYRCCEAKSLTVPPPKNIVLPSEDVKLKITEDDFNWVMKSASVLQSPHIAVVGDGTKLSIKTFNAQDDSAHTDSLEMENSTSTCHFVFKTENWKMIPGTYNLTISSKGISTFQHETRKLQYWIALELGSK